MVLAPWLVACGASGDDSAGHHGEFEHAYATSAIVFGENAETAYVSVLPNLEVESVKLDDAIEYPGWASVSAADGKLYISDGEAPIMTRYEVEADGGLDEEQAISFQSFGAASAGGAFVADDKAYLFAQTGVIWDPIEMEVTGTFDLPEIEDQEGGRLYSGLSTGRAFAKSGNLAYVATNWANWDTYEVSEDSLIVVIDTTKNEIVKTIPVSCPYLDVASVDDDGYVYFSNWGYSVPQTLLYGKKPACAVRVAPGEDALDESWSFNFADVTGGHEGAALRYLGDGKALFVAYDETRLDGKTEEEYPGELADLSNWQFWTVDLKTLDATPVQGLDWTSGGYYMSRVGGRTFLLSPNDDYSTTSFYEVNPNGTAVLRFVGEGWSHDLVQVR